MKIIFNLVAQIPAKRQKIKIYVLKVMEWFGQFYIKKHEKQDHLPLRTNYKWYKKLSNMKMDSGFIFKNNVTEVRQKIAWT